MPPPSEQLLTREAVDVVAACVRVALAAESGLELEPPRIGAPHDAVVAAARHHRVAALLVDRSRELALPAAIVDELRPAAFGDTRRALVLAQQTRDLQELLAVEGIESAAIKGIALSIMTTGTINGRGAGDIDLLVRRDDVPRVHDVLVGNGLSLRIPHPPTPGWWWRWVGWMRRELSYVDGSRVLDLHWRVALDHSVLPPTARLLDRVQVVSASGVELRTLARPDALAAACFTAYYDRYARLRSLVDVARLARDPAASLPPDLSRRGRALVATTVSLASGILGMPAPALDVPSAPPSWARDMWREASVRPVWSTVPIPARELPALWMHHARFARPLPATAMVACDMILKPELLDPQAPGYGFGPAIRGELDDLVTRRLRRR